MEKIFIKKTVATLLVVLMTGSAFFALPLTVGAAEITDESNVCLYDDFGDESDWYGITELELISSPDNQYDVGYEFDFINDLAGTVVEATYSDGSKSILTYSNGYFYSESGDSYTPICSFYDSETYQMKEYCVDWSENDVLKVVSGSNRIEISIDGEYCYLYVNSTYEVSKIDITKLPNTTTWIADKWEENNDSGISVTYEVNYNLDGLEADIYLKNGEVYHYVYNDDYFFVDDKYEIRWTYDGSAENFTYGTNTMYMHCSGATAEFNFTAIEDPYIQNPPVKMEVTKLPDKVFTAPYEYLDYIPEDIWSQMINPYSDQKVLLDTVYKNQVSRHMKGAQMEITYKDGSKKTFTFGDVKLYVGQGSSNTSVYEFEYGKCFYVSEVGNYKAQIYYENLSVEITARSSEDVTVGDVNGDGTTSVEELDTSNVAAADFNGDGYVTVEDATAMQRFVAGVE